MSGLTRRHQRKGSSRSQGDSPAGFRLLNSGHPFTSNAGRFPLDRYADLSLFDGARSGSSNLPSHLMQILDKRLYLGTDQPA